ncbi:MAG: hypothetical protein D6799_07675 [Bacteroidetes bacterium]|nr:MAG: hypothetical protein D6799_07675 [Bacteroidota bacterium]
MNYSKKHILYSNNKIKSFCFIISILLLQSFVFSQNISENDQRANTPIPFTLADRDRLIKIETEQNNIKEEIKEIRENFRWIIGLLVTSYASLVALIIWDRRTTTKPLERKVTILEQEFANNKEDKSQLQQLIKALQELSKTDEKVANVLKQFNLL